MTDNNKKYFLPLNDIPFNKIPSLGDFKYKYVECEEIRIDNIFLEGTSIVKVFNVFHIDKTESYIDTNNVLFGPVLSQNLSTRGKVKCISKAKKSVKIIEQNLPELKFTTKNGLTFFTKGGKYSAMYGIEANKERVNHLEGIHIYGDWLLKLRVVIELLKKNVKEGLVQLDIKDYKEIAHKVLRSEPALEKFNEFTYNDAVNNWIPSMLSMPLIEDIPKVYIGKVMP